MNFWGFRFGKKLKSLPVKDQYAFLEDAKELTLLDPKKYFLIWIVSYLFVNMFLLFGQTIFGVLLAVFLFMHIVYSFLSFLVLLHRFRVFWYR